MVAFSSLLPLVPVDEASLSRTHSFLIFAFVFLWICQPTYISYRFCHSGSCTGSYMQYVLSSVGPTPVICHITGQTNVSPGDNVIHRQKYTVTRRTLPSLSVVPPYRNNRLQMVSKTCDNWHQSATIGVTLLQLVASCFKTGCHRMASKGTTLPQLATNPYWYNLSACLKSCFATVLELWLSADSIL